MPRTRVEVGRDDKVDELVDAARARLLAGGYADLSVAAIARELGIAQNAVYWYFPTKDHLLVAGADRILHDILARKPRQGSVVDRIVWFTDRLAEIHDLRLAIHERARQSDVVAAYEADVVALLRTLLRGMVDDDATVDAVLALCEGALLRRLPRSQRADLVRFGCARLLA